MAAIISDIDGTVFYFGTNTPIPSAIAQLSALQAEGDTLLFITQAGFSEDRQATIEAIFGKVTVIYNVPSPRVVINDAGAYAIDHETNMPWHKAYLARMRSWFGR